MQGVIYKYTFPDGKIYVGQTRRPLEIRHKEHISPVTGPLNPGFWSAYQKFRTVQLEILETIEQENGIALTDALNARETYYIRTLNATNPKYGYNKRSCGTSFSSDQLILDAEFERIWTIVAQQGYPTFCFIYDKIASGQLCDLTEDEKTFIRSSLLNNNLHSNALQTVMDADTFLVEGEEDLFWLEEAIEYAQFVFNEESWTDIRRYLAENASTIIHNAKEANAILQIDDKGNIVREYLDADEIRKAFNIQRIDNITNVLKGRQKTAYGFIWRYKNGS